MYRGYNLDIEESAFNQWLEVGKISHVDTKKRVKETLDSFKDRNGKLIASKITASWFPSIDANVFISHSHSDAEMAIGLSGWLKKEFGLTSFIDSCVWGYSRTLQELIDKEYSRKNSNNDSYDYEKLIRSAAHVNMMLSVALTKMIDRCECIFFLNTPQSISSKDYIDGKTTESPWIYSEIAMTSLIQRREPSAHRVVASLERYTESVHILHEVSLKHLTNINVTDLRQWNNSCKSRTSSSRYLEITGAKALDKLYEMDT